MAGDSVQRDVFSHRHVAQLAAAAGEPSAVEKLKTDYKSTFQEFPPRQEPASFSIDQALEKAREKQETMAAAAPVRKK